MIRARPPLSSLIALLIATSAGSSQAAAPARGGLPATWPVDSLRAGMTGYGLSVFRGTSVDTFQLTILGVLKGNRPQADLILGRAKGDFLERTGIIAGMSGSPVYVRGKLIGAVSYTWAFTKDPVAGITPIGEMLASLRSGPEDRDEKLEPSDARYGALDLPPGAASPVPGEARPIATPLALSGFTPEALRYLSPWLDEHGFVSAPGGGAPGEGSCDSIVPGSAVGVDLVRGDMSATAIGTVTYRDGSRVLAFGHPFYALGRVQLPMSAATIHTIFASQQISTKVGSSTKTCGTLVADRSVGIAGELGPSPSMIPLSVAIHGPHGRDRSYRFEVARSRSLTPGLAAATIVGSISEALFDVGLATTRYDLTYSLNGGKETLHRGNAIVAPAPLSGAGDDVSQTLFLLLVNRFEPVRLDSLHVEINVQEGLDQAVLTSVRVRPTMAAPGESVQVELSIQPTRAKAETRVVTLRIPPGTPSGDVTVRVCNGPDTDKWDRERAPEAYEPQSLDHLLGLLSGERRGDQLFVQLYKESKGVTVHGGEISQVPPSVLDVLGGGTKFGESGPVKGATLSEITVPTGRVMSGCEQTTLTVLPYRAR
jgi:SpoIVB peptidase S55